MPCVEAFVVLLLVPPVVLNDSLAPSVIVSPTVAEPPTPIGAADVVAETFVADD